MMRKRFYRSKLMAVVMCLILACTSVVFSGAVVNAATGGNESESGEKDGAFGAARTMETEYYVLLNDAWYLTERSTDLLETDPDSWKVTNGQARHYTTAAELEKIYGRYGFKAADYNGERIFPHTDSDSPETLWGDTDSVKVDGEWRIPLSFRNNVYVYYVPKGLPGDSGSMKRSDTDKIKDSGFYTCVVSDPAGTGAKTGTSYIAAGGSHSVTLKNMDGVTWRVVNAATGSEMSSDEYTKEEKDGTTKLTFDNMNVPIKISSSTGSMAEYTIKYNAATLKDNLRTMGDINPERQGILSDGKIEGNDSVEKTWNEESEYYTLLHPDSDKCKVSGYTNASRKNKKFFYKFKGWKVAGTDVLLEPGQELTAAELHNYERDGVITLEAAWGASDKNYRVNTANFYVNLDCEVADNESDGINSEAQDKFTNSLYAASVLNGDNENIPSGNGSIKDLDYILLMGKDGTSAYEIDKEIRKMTADGWNGVTFEDFPSDEDILAELRSSGAEINVPGLDDPVSGDKLNTTNFKVRWYVVKYEHSDGWHVDGILVAKEGYIQVTKTFSGTGDSSVEDSDASVNIPDGFYISVDHEGSDGKTVSDYKLTLDSAEAAGSGETGYTKYDEETGTYTWVLKVRHKQEYTIKEHNYKMDSDEWHNFNRYQITNSDAATGGWVKYTADGVKITGESYPNDVTAAAYQTVEFQNTYVKSGLLTLSKIDSFSNEGLSGVEFTVSPAKSAAAFSLHKKPGSSEYSSAADAAQNGYTETVQNGSVVTDAVGNVYLKLEPGDYKLTETFPSGYHGAAEIDIHVNDDGEVTKATAVGSDGAEIADMDGILSGVGTSRLTVKNQSSLLTTVTAEAGWGSSTPEKEQKAVRVELWCNGARLVDANGAAYEQQLDKDNGWKYVWKDLPLFVNGDIAHYSLREVRIGDTEYDSGADADGYRDYAVTYAPAQYREGSSGDYDDEASWVDEDGVQHYANHALLRVQNRLDNGSRVVFVTKQWDDGDDKDEIRPDSITVHLYKNGKKTERSLVLSPENNWSGYFTELRQYEDGEEIEYTVEEDEVEGYTSRMDGDADTGYTIVNSHTPSKPSDGEDPSDPSKPSGDKDPSDSSKPSDPSVKPSDPTNPSVPSGDEDPSEPSTKPADPTDPSDPSGDKDPSDASKPSDSSDKYDPAQPSGSSDASISSSAQNADSAAGTGDDSHPALFAMMAILAAGTGTTAVVCGRRNRRNKKETM